MHVSSLTVGHVVIVPARVAVGGSEPCRRYHLIQGRRRLAGLVHLPVDVELDWNWIGSDAWLGLAGSLSGGGWLLEIEPLRQSRVADAYGRSTHGESKGKHAQSAEGIIRSDSSSQCNMQKVN
jgi:hypothetical protein